MEVQRKKPRISCIRLNSKFVHLQTIHVPFWALHLPIFSIDRLAEIVCWVDLIDEISLILGKFVKV